MPGVARAFERLSFLTNISTINFQAIQEHSHHRTSKTDSSHVLLKLLKIIELLHKNNFSHVSKEGVVEG